MKVESHEGARERQIVTAMITDEAVLARLSAIYNHEMFLSRWSNLVAGWTVRYYQKYRRAPKKHIEQIYANWARKTQDTETSQLISNLLTALSDEYEKEALLSPDYLIDRAGEYLNEVRLRKLSDTIGDYLATGKVEDALRAASSFSKIEVGLGSVFEPLADDLAIEAAFRDRGKSLIQWEGDLGIFMKDAFSRDSLVGILACEGVGKSACLLEIAYTAMMQGLKVLYFEAGDNSQNQLMRRLLVRASGQPWNPGPVQFPTSLSLRNDNPLVGYQSQHFTTPLDPKYGRECAAKARELAAEKGGGLWFSCHATGTLSIEAVESILDAYERDGKPLDLTIIDYADIMQPPPAKEDVLHQIELLWQQLRSLSQKRRCLVVTATQATREAYKGFLLAKQHVSGNKLKLANVNAMLGLNQTDSDKKLGCYRINFLKLRSDDFVSSQTVTVAGCLALARPWILSVL